MLELRLELGEMVAGLASDLLVELAWHLRSLLKAEGKEKLVISVERD